MTQAKVRSLTLRSFKDVLDVSVGDKNVKSLLDAFQHIAARIRLVYFIPGTFSKSKYQLILICNFEKKYYTTCPGGAKRFCSVYLCTSFHTYSYIFFILLELTVTNSFLSLRQT